MFKQPFWVVTFTSCSAVATVSSFLGDIVDSPLVALVAGLSLLALALVAFVVMAVGPLRRWLEAATKIDIPGAGAGIAGLGILSLAAFPLAFAGLTSGLQPVGGIKNVLASELSGRELLEHISATTNQVLAGQETDRAVNFALTYGQGACELNGYRRRTIVGYFQSQGSFYTLDNVSYQATVSDGSSTWTFRKFGLQTLGVKDQGFNECGGEAGSIWVCAVGRDPASGLWYRWKSSSSDFAMASRGIPGEDTWLELSLILSKEVFQEPVKCD